MELAIWSAMSPVSQPYWPYGYSSGEQCSSKDLFQVCDAFFNLTSANMVPVEFA